MAHPDPDRRRLLALGGMILTTLAALPGCGGGGEDDAGDSGNGSGGDGSGGGGGGVGGGGTTLTAPQREAALQAVVAEVGAASTNGALRFDSDALAARLRTMPVLTEVGVARGMQNVWARFTDGRMLVVVNNLDPVVTPAAGGAASAQPQRADRKRALAAGDGFDMPSLLTEQQYRQIDAFGQPPLDSSVAANHLCQSFIGPETLRDLRLMAMARGLFEPPAWRQQAPGFETTVEGLRSVGGDGVFMINGTAAATGDETSGTVAICTLTPANAQTEARYAAELAAGQLVYAVHPVGDGQAWAPLACLAITPAFAAANGWQFPARSVAVLNLAGGSVLWAWERTLRAAGLRNVLGWTAPVSATRMVAFADDLMQLLLATNRIGRNAARYGVTWPPRLRTHGIGATAFFLSTRGGDLETPRLPLDYLPESVAPLIVQTLLPTIDHVLIREGSREAEFIGLFGAQRDSVADPVQLDGRSRVVFGTSYGEVGEGLLVSDEARALVADAADPPVRDTIGVDRILDWSKGNVITVDISRAGPRGGYLQVRNGGRISNAVPITYWRIPVVATAEIEGGLQVRCTITLHLRADVSGHRLEPDDKPHEVRTMIPLESMFECDAVYEASGGISRTVDRVTTTITWSGGSRNANAAPGFHDIGCSGILDMLARRLPITLTAGNGVHDQRTVKKRDNEFLLDETTPRPASLAVRDLPQAPLAFEFDERWTLLAGQHRSPGEPVDVLGRRALTYSVSWGQVTPEFPPADDFGGT